MAAKSRFRLFASGSFPAANIKAQVSAACHLQTLVTDRIQADYCILIHFMMKVCISDDRSCDIIILSGEYLSLGAGEQY